MKIIPTKINGVFIIEPKVFEDDRGWFQETYNKEKFIEFGIQADFVQDSHSYTKKKGTLRGLHFQKAPHSQAKFVTCIKGSLLDVAVDLRTDSPTYKQWISVELTEGNKKKLFIPRGFAHGFITLEDDTEFYYKLDNYYNKESEGFIRFNDPEIGIDWGNTNPILIERDATAPFLKDSGANF